MPAHVRSCLSLLFVLVLGGVCASAARGETFGVQEANFEVGTCIKTSCTYASVKSDHSEAFTQAAGHPPYGITSFELNSEELTGGIHKPLGAIKRVRVDVPRGLAADPQALERCSRGAFEQATPACPSGSKVGTDELTIYEPLGPLGVNATVSAEVYDLEQPAGLPLEFGIYTSEVPAVAKAQHIYLEGHVSWDSDYHEWFEINNISKEVQVLKSKLIFDGTAGAGDFLTLPSECSSSNTAHITVESYEGVVSETYTHTPVGVEGCPNVPFEPTVEALPETAASDEPDGVAIAVKVPQHAGSGEINTADIDDARVLLPEGLTLNPSAAQGLQACTPAQIAIGEVKAVTCPAASKIGTVTIETDLPPGSLSGDVYLASPSGGAISGGSASQPEYAIYLDAESVYGVSVRLAGIVTPDPASGRVEVNFDGNPPLPFSELAMKMNGGPTAPLANPLACSTQQTEATFTPYTGLSSALSSTPFTTSGCASPLPFSPTQSTSDASPDAGATTGFTLNLARASGEQYLAALKTVLPQGLVGRIPAVKLCEEPQASAGTCGAESEIGSASVQAGAGSAPYSFAGHVYLTGPYDGAPYGLSVVVPAVAGPFNLGLVVTRARIDIDPSTAQVLVESTLPTIVKGVPMRLRSVSVTINRPGFMLNPTACGTLPTLTTLTGFTPGSTASVSHELSSPITIANCQALKFKPAFTASTSAKTSKLSGASLETTINMPAGDANIKSVLVQLPKQLVSRESTLQQSCLAATFAANPYGCPAGSYVGSVRANTPLLPSEMTGSAVLVSHGGAAFPDLDLVLGADGVRVVLVGNTKITKDLTTTNFADTPDVPVSSITIVLPLGPHSALAANGPMCPPTLLMPTTITAYNGLSLKQDTVIKPTGCGVQILGHKVKGSTAYLKIKTFEAGRISVGGAGLASVKRKLRAASRVTTLKVALSSSGLARRRPLKVRVRVGFKPKARKMKGSQAFVTVRFR